LTGMIVDHQLECPPPRTPPRYGRTYKAAPTILLSHRRE
jgi:hypothetical protein